MSQRRRSDPRFSLFVQNPFYFLDQGWNEAKEVLSFSEELRVLFTADVQEHQLCASVGEVCFCIARRGNGKGVPRRRYGIDLQTTAKRVKKLLPVYGKHGGNVSADDGPIDYEGRVIGVPGIVPRNPHLKEKRP